jgi:septal ring factor EnvC (AmiA/AmiB activator)
MADPQPDPLAQRLDKFEELQSFADRRTDQLSEQMAALERKLREVEARLRRLEDGLGRLDERIERIPVPPTSAGLPPGAENP